VFQIAEGGLFQFRIKNLELRDKAKAAFRAAFAKTFELKD
jgi:hypothetical protein